MILVEGGEFSGFSKRTPQMDFIEDTGIVFLTIVVGSFMFVVGLAWNDFFVNLFDRLFGRNDLLGMLAYALAVTLLLIVIIYLIQRYTSKGISSKFQLLPQYFASGVSRRRF